MTFYFLLSQTQCTVFTFVVFVFGRLGMERESGVSETMILLSLISLMLMWQRFSLV